MYYMYNFRTVPLQFGIEIVYILSGCVVSVELTVHYRNAGIKVQYIHTLQMNLIINHQSECTLCTCTCTLYICVYTV